MNCPKCGSPMFPQANLFKDLPISYRCEDCAIEVVEGQEHKIIYSPQFIKGYNEAVMDCLRICNQYASVFVREAITKLRKE